MGLVAQDRVSMGQYVGREWCGAGEVVWDMGAMFTPLDLADIL